ncbi:MAG TPA: aminopeptidase P N-terminal domain-containing protein [Chthonomonadaceae bacterium]|nr:aminopeptidase P N-terminal domain-containing protein [Chthonomonadaceae bacterium]
MTSSLTPAGLPPEEFVARRDRVYDAIGPEAVALIQGAGPTRGFELFRQTNEFLYLSGLAAPQAYLLLDGRSRRTALYLPHRSPHAGSEGESLGAEDVAPIQALTGVEAVYGLEALAEHLAGVRHLYTPHSPAEGRQGCRDELLRAAKAIAADPWDAAPSREERFIGLLCERVPNLEIHDLSPLLDAMRLIKSPREVAIMRRAGELTARAVVEAMRSTRPGVMEYELGAVADYVFRVNGARMEGYRAIIAGGKNIWYAHYYRNDCPLLDGDLALMDYAPDVCNYTSDIGRMWPVNGVYSPVQRELYGFIVQYHKVVLGRIRPGVLPEQILAEAAEEMRPIVEGTAFSKPIYQEAARRTLDWRGHLSHPVGMAVHDVGSYFDRPLEPGLVISIDPSLWVPEERLYIRVEDTVAVTEEGVEVLTALAPLDLDDVEAVMREDGLLQQFPPVAHPKPHPPPHHGPSGPASPS